MADYEEQARAGVDSLEITWGDERDYDEAVMVVARLARRSAELAAEDATRRERERCAALCDEAADDEDRRGNSDAYGMARFCAKRIRGEAARVGVQPATPPPPRPATGGARCSHLTNAPHEICTAIATTTDPTGCYPLCAEHAARYAPTPPARTEDGGRCEECGGDGEHWTPGGNMFPCSTCSSPEVRKAWNMSGPPAPPVPGDCVFCDERKKPPPPEPEPARSDESCESLACNHRSKRADGRVVRCVLRPGHSADEGERHLGPCEPGAVPSMKVRALVEAARAAEVELARIVRRRDNAIETYEEDAAEFRSATGFTAPGKDMSPYFGGGDDDEEARRAAWRKWCDEKTAESFARWRTVLVALRAALAGVES